MTNYKCEFSFNVDFDQSSSLIENTAMKKTITSNGRNDNTSALK